MKYLLWLLVLLFTFSVSEAQYNVVFKLEKYPLLREHTDTIFVAGNFNGWDPQKNGYDFSVRGNMELQLLLPAGRYEYKCTRGSWKKVECLSDGRDIDNHFFEISGDTTIGISIEAWKDDFAAVSKKHTAGKQVHIMDTAFYIPQLNRTRRIWVYLPEGYSKSRKSYPVLYMHDGQNLFDASTAAFGEWGVDECLDSLIRTGKPACIVVGIDNGPQRVNEYNPYEFQQFGPGEGDLYLGFLVQTLKPFIDKKYRTLPNRDNTIIAGSSMGGLISYYAMLQQPAVFGKAGIFSPSFWTAPPIRSLTDSLGDKMEGKFFFYMGGKEGEEYIKDMEDIAEILGERSSSMIYSVIDPDSSHNEKAWHKWFPEFYTWIMANGFNTVIKLK